MAEQIVKVLVEGGKATAAPPLGPALGPMGVNIGQVVSDINKKTTSFQGMQVPVKVIIDSTTKQYEIEVGTPPTSALLKKESGIEKGSGNPKMDKVADVLIEQIIKISKMKESSLLGKSLKERVKEVIGTCHSMGILVEGKIPSDVIKEVDSGKYNDEISTEKTELSEEEKRLLDEERKRLASELEKRRAEFDRVAKEIIASMSGKERGAIKAKLKEVGIPDSMIKELLPVEGAQASTSGTTTPAKSEAKKDEPKEKQKK
jgi:large subunit ribosomal protein L11